MRVIVFLDGNFSQFFASELRSICSQTRLTEHARSYAIIEIDHSSVHCIQKLGSISSAFILFDPSQEDYWNFIFDNIVSHVGYFIPRTFSFEDFSRFRSFYDRVYKLIKSAVPDAVVSLYAPQISIRAFKINSSFYVGVRLTLARDALISLEPMYRPYAPPASMEILLVRILNNLAWSKPDYAFLDPFCGTGSFVIDAWNLGAKKIICIDKDPAKILAAKMLAEYYGVSGIIFVIGDARNLGMIEDTSIDIISTDPPYGIGSPTFGISINRLYREFLYSAWRVLRPKAKITLCFTPKIKAKEYALEVGFKVEHLFSMKIHSKLTRIVGVFRA